MPSATFIILNYVCPSIGIILASLTFAAPISSLRDAIAKGSLGDLNPTPWAFMTGNCLGWIGYSYLTKDLFVLSANIPGLMVSVWLNMGAVKLQFREYYEERVRVRGRHYEEPGPDLASLPDGGLESDAETNDDSGNSHGDDDDDDAEMEIVPSTVPHEKKVLRILILWVAVFSAVAHINMTRQMREEIIGVIVNINLTFFYGAPLSTIADVLRTRSSASLHVRTVAMMVFNAFFWLAYGVAVLDPFIYVPNGIGFLLGLLQALLLLLFPSKGGIRQGMLRVSDGNDLSDGLIEGDEADDFENDPTSISPSANETSIV